MMSSGEERSRDAGVEAENSAAIVLCEVFRSPRREGMYLYVERSEGLAHVPEALLKVFGTPESALVFRLTPDRPLARASAPAVLEELRERGFYLQMPPVPGAVGDAEGRDENRKSGEDENGDIRC